MVAFEETKSLFEKNGGGGTPPKESPIASRAAAYERAAEGNKDKDNEKKPPPPQGKGAMIHKKIEHPWRDEDRRNMNLKKISARPTARPSLVDASAFASISKTRVKKQEERSKPVTPRKRKLQIAKCSVLSIIILSFIILAAITILTGWGDGTTEMEFGRQGTVPGKLVSVSEDGSVAVVEDDFGSNRVYRLDPNATPQWRPPGSQFRSRGRVEVSKDGARLAYMHSKTSRLRIVRYDETARDWVSTGGEPILGGDDVSIDGDFSTLCVGSYGLGTITQSNDRVGEGTITSYKSNGTDWLVHGGPITKIFNLTFFGLSPDGRSLVVMSSSGDGNVTVDGYQSDAPGNGTYEWLESDRTVAIPAPEDDGEVTMAVSNAGYAVSTPTGVQAYAFSGRRMGGKISAGGDHNITSVALNAGGDRMVVGSVSPDGRSGVVDWYRCPKGEAGADWEWKHLGFSLRDGGEFFGAAVRVNAGATRLAVQDGFEGAENVHFYSVIYKAHRRI